MNKQNQNKNTNLKTSIGDMLLNKLAIKEKVTKKRIEHFAQVRDRAYSSKHK